MDLNKEEAFEQSLKEFREAIFSLLIPFEWEPTNEELIQLSDLISVVELSKEEDVQICFTKIFGENSVFYTAEGADFKDINTILAMLKMKAQKIQDGK